jgi:hypothetical protein
VLPFSFQLPLHVPDERPGGLFYGACTVIALFSDAFYSSSEHVSFLLLCGSKGLNILVLCDTCVITGERIMMRLTGSLVLSLVLAFVVGCEWTGSSGGSTWDDSYSWVNFSGTYRAPDGGTIVSSFNVTTGGSEPTDTQITGEIIATGVSGTDQYNGTLDNTPVKEGSLTINAGTFTLTDDGDGTLTGTAGTDGTVDYETGSWSIDLKGQIIADGEIISASYIYTSGGEEGQPDSGTDDDAIFSLIVSQTGNLLAITDSNGGSLSGTISSVSSGGGDSSGLTSGQVTATFSAEGTSSGGHAVTLMGTLYGDYVAPTVEAETGSTTGGGSLNSRVMDGTWIQGNDTADVYGTAGSVDITVTTTTTDDTQQ